jgi:DNA-binding transcriptional ArsR family regulator
MDEWNLDEIPEPDDEFRITNLETLKVLTDPLRLRIVEELIDGPRTVKQLARTMEMKPTKLYYHINLMEEHGLIRVVSTRVVSGIIEKLYHVRAFNYPMDRSLMGMSEAAEDEGLPAMLASVLEHTGQEIKRSIKSGLITMSEQLPEKRTFMMLRSFGLHSKDDIHEFITRFEALLEEFNDRGSEDREGEEYRVYGMTLALYPTHHTRLPAKMLRKEQ